MFRIVLIFFGSCLLFLSCKQHADIQKLPYYNSADFTPVFIDDSDSISFKISHRIGKFNLMDQHGHTLTQHEIDGKIHVANFFFTGCGSICPGMMEKIKKVNLAFGDTSHVIFLSYSVTPWRDSVSRLKQYAISNNINAANWHLLTGTRNEIYALARQSYFAEEELGFSKDSTDFLHTEHVLLVDKTGRIRGIYNGTLELDMYQLRDDISVLLAEK